MKKENYLPFDLETALKHPERVVTLDGKKVNKIYLFDDDDAFMPLAAIVDKKVRSYTKEGSFYGYTSSGFDLFLLPDVKECWVNVYDDGTSFIRIGDGKYRSMDEAKFNITDSLGTYIKTIRITNEPE